MTHAERLPPQAQHALAALVRGFAIADERSGRALLHDVVDDFLDVSDDDDGDEDHVGDGLRAVVLRLVYLLCADARPLNALFERLRGDAARAASPLRERHGAWARLLGLFRRVHDDARVGGGLFDPDRWPFLEGRRRGTRRAQATPLPRVPDDVVLRVLELLLVVDGARVDHAALDVAVLGAVYEHLRDLRVRRARGTSLALGPRHVVVDVESLLALPGDARAAWLREHARVTLTERARDALSVARVVDDVVVALARRASPLSPQPTPAGALVLVPTAARRRAGMHYTPRALTVAVVRATIAPLVAALGPQPSPEQILALKVCDPAMGAGAFLVEACRQLADHVVAAEGADGRAVDAALGASLVDVARRRVAQRCLFGVDRDALAVELARLSLGLVAGARDADSSTASATSTIASHLRCGDALVGFSPAQIDAFDWHDPPRAPPPPRTTADDARSRAALRRRGDALVDVFFAHDDARAREAARRAPLVAAAEDLAPTTTRTTKATTRPSAFHWQLEFPAVFAGETPGFHAVVGNPPFLNAIEARSRRSRTLSTLYAALYPTFARGAYDLCVLFLARTTTTLLRRDGRYGLLVPLALLSSDQPWRRFMHERWRPDALFAWPVDRFDGAAIRVAALVGGAGAADACAVYVDDGSARGDRVHRYRDDDANWYAALATSDDDDGGGADAEARGEVLALAPIALSSRFAVHAGCATGVAYALRPLVVDAATTSAPEALKLVTTGALDRYRLRWSDDVVRFLKRDHRWPRWPAGDAPTLPRDVVRARDAQRRPKLLVGGLSAVLEAWFDDDGSAGGVVSTWVIAPRAPSGHASDAAPVDDRTTLKALAVIVNAASSSRAFMRIHGAGALSGHQTTIKKAALLSSTIPDVFADRRGFSQDAFARVLADRGASTAGVPARFVDQLAALHDRLASFSSSFSSSSASAASSASASFAAVDAVAHVVVARLSGRTCRQALDDLRWWRRRERRSALDGIDVDAVAARVYALPVVDA